MRKSFEHEPSKTWGTFGPSFFHEPHVPSGRIMSEDEILRATIRAESAEYGKYLVNCAEAGQIRRLRAEAEAKASPTRRRSRRSHAYKEPPFDPREAPNVFHVMTRGLPSTKWHGDGYRPARRLHELHAATEEEEPPPSPPSPPPVSAFRNFSGYYRSRISGAKSEMRSPDSAYVPPMMRRRLAAESALRVLDSRHRGSPHVLRV